jgi:hypothetical protein
LLNGSVEFIVYPAHITVAHTTNPTLETTHPQITVYHGT